MGGNGAERVAKFLSFQLSRFFPALFPRLRIGRVTLPQASHQKDARDRSELENQSRQPASSSISPHLIDSLQTWLILAIPVSLLGSLRSAILGTTRLVVARR